MSIPDGDVEDLARDMLKHFPTDAADRAVLRSNALHVLGYVEKSVKWIQVSEEIKKMQSGKT